MQSNLRRCLTAVSAMLIMLAFAGRCAGNLAINLTYGPGLAGNPAAQSAFDHAASRWAAVLNTSVTVNVTVDFESLGTNTLGSSSMTTTKVQMDTVRSMMINSTNPADTRKLNLLSALPTSDDWAVKAPPNITVGGWVEMTTANYKAIGGSSSGTDGSITFTTDLPWDFDPSNGVDAGKYDFEGVAVHELGHILGFYSAVDMVDQAVHSNVSFIVYPTTLDLFRFQTSILPSPNFNFTTSPRYFVPGGSHSFYYGDGSVLMSTGYYEGDGRQASHWKDLLGLGIMDPTAAKGETLVMTQNDLIAMDMIGWDTTPEPATLCLLSIGAAFIMLRRKRRLAN